MSWYVYILQCADHTFYTGVTDNLAARLFAHNYLPEGAKYTKTRRPVRLLYSEKCTNRSDAQMREYEIKKLSRTEKVALLNK